MNRRFPIASLFRAHGLRKTFTTLTVNSKMDTIKRKMLEGHAIGIDSHYYKPSEADLLEEYQTKALDNLTIDIKIKNSLIIQTISKNLGCLRRCQR